MKVLLPLFILLIACESGSNPNLQQAGAPFPDTPRLLDVATSREVLDEVNLLRQSGCLCPGNKRFPPTTPLRWNDQLEAAAQAHADDMYRRNYFSHTSADGTDFSDRISRAGYDWKAVGENIAKGYPTARAVVKAWRESRDHCPNLMNTEFQDMGVGKTGPYWVQNLGVRH